MENDALYMIGGIAVLLFFALVGLIYTIRRRIKHRRLVQDISARLDEDFGISDTTEFRSLPHQDDDIEGIDPHEVWTEGHK